MNGSLLILFSCFVFSGLSTQEGSLEIDSPYSLKLGNSVENTLYPNAKALKLAGFFLGPTHSSQIVPRAAKAGDDFFDGFISGFLKGIKIPYHLLTGKRPEKKDNQNKGEIWGWGNYIGSSFGGVWSLFFIFGIGVAIFHGIKNARNRNLLSLTDDGSLINAAGDGDLTTVKSLIDRGVDVNATPRNNQPALFKAIKKQQVEIVGLLLDSGADCKGVYNEETALWVAVCKRNKEIVQLLLAKDADINDNRNPNKETPLQVAKRLNDDELFDLLRNWFYKD